MEHGLWRHFAPRAGHTPVGRNGFPFRERTAFVFGLKLNPLLTFHPLATVEELQYRVHGVTRWKE